MKKKLTACLLIFVLVLTSIAPISVDAATLTWPILEFGDTGANVTALQYLLNYYGYGLTVNGTFNSSTDDAVREFQSQEYLTVDGIVETDMWIVLTAVPAQRMSSYNSDLTKAIQYLLNNKFGFELPAVNGIFDLNTKMAVMMVQAKLNLPQNGMVDANTWNNLISASAQDVYAYYTEGEYVRLDLELSYYQNITPANLKVWIDRLDSAYLSYEELVGATPQNGTKINIVDSSGTYGWAWVYPNTSTIYWQEDYIASTFGQINNTGDWSFGILHEMGHLFDLQNKWNFNAEFFAVFKSYYVIEQLSAAVIPDSYTSVLYVGDELKAFFETDADSSYDNAFANGVFSWGGAEHLFIMIKDAIGWEPFAQTFRYFSDLPSPPATNLGKFNLFMTKLRDFSHANVLGKISPEDLALFEEELGGTIAYTNRLFLGDADGDGDVTAADASAILRHVVSIAPITDPELLVNADVNLDGAVNSADSSAILRYLVNLDTLPPGQ
ncbi:MAG: peptidoglycan-binding protein [Oscillospiraceae bacterium]|jgi:hypothetical protein|nr:peptidoglycan-binding protein [Oscillospiraceae bacterium]